MIYNRRFMIQSSHFNGEAEYALLQANPNSVDAWRIVCTNSHGHNFIIYVEVGMSEANLAKDEHQFYAVEDTELEALVKEWDATNLSVHSDFTAGNYRATTERICEVLARKIWNRLVKPRMYAIGAILDAETYVQVRTYENESIYAEYKYAFC